MAAQKPNRAAQRAAARLAAVQALYQMDVSQAGLAEVMAQFEAYWLGREVDGVEAGAPDLDFFRDILQGVVREQRPIDLKVDAALAAKWPLKRVEAVLRAILRAGGYELMFRKDVPARVAITEYVEVAHGFYGEDEPGMVNAVLDAVAHEVRAEEFAKGR